MDSGRCEGGRRCWGGEGASVEVLLLIALCFLIAGKGYRHSSVNNFVYNILNMTHRRLVRLPGGDLEDREGRSIGSDRRGAEWVVKVADGGLAGRRRDWGDGLGGRRGWNEHIAYFWGWVLCEEGTYGST